MMRTKENEKDKGWQRTKEITVETIKDISPYIAIGAIVILLVMFLNGSVSVYQKDVGYVELSREDFKDPRVISITSATGERTVNPLAGYDTSNAACADTASRFNQAKALLCSARMKADMTEARDSHQWFLDHYKAEYYNFSSQFQGLNATATLWKAQEWERRWIKVYDDMLAGCKQLEVKP